MYIYMEKRVKRARVGAEFSCNETKPNIFLIGDSLRLGYCKPVKDSLCDEAEVFYIADNCKSTQYVIFNVLGWANQFDDPALVDVVHFNCGHWDAAHFFGAELSLTSIEEYGRNLRVLSGLLRRFFPNARLVFATSTPMNPDPSAVEPSPRSNEELDAYNRVAVEVMKECGVAVNDLNAYMRDWGSDCFADACHLTPAAYVRLGEEIAQRLRGYMA